MLVRILTRAGCVPDGADALAAIRAAPPAAVVLHVTMPDVGGFDVLAAVRADPATAADAQGPSPIGV